MDIEKCKPYSHSVNGEDHKLVAKLKPFVCDICQIRYDEKTHLKQHIGHRHLPKNRKCPDCPVMVNNISIVSHQQTHRKKHICEKCGRLFQTTKRLLVHKEKICSSLDDLKCDADMLSKKFKCIICSYRGPNERALNKHVQRVHQSKNLEKTKTCDICKKQFNKISYSHHIRSHGRIQCEKCKKWLSTGSGFFKQHMLNHKKAEEDSGNIKIFQKAVGSDGIFRCYDETCTYKTHKKRLFVRHWQNRHGPKILKCDYPGCETGSMSEKQLWRHKNLHKRKDCQHCGTLFNELRDLNRHIANKICIESKSEVYQNSTPIHDLKCDKCSYTTYQSSALIRHRLHYHAPLIGKCTYPGCKNEEIMTKAKLTVHLKRHKNVSLNFTPLENENSSRETNSKILHDSFETVELQVLNQFKIESKPKCNMKDKNSVNKINEEIRNSQKTKFKLEDSIDDNEIDIVFELDIDTQKIGSLKTVKEVEPSIRNNDDPFNLKSNRDDLKIKPDIPTENDDKIIMGTRSEYEGELKTQQIQKGKVKNELISLTEISKLENNVKYLCEKCSYVTQNKKNLQYHMIMIHDSKLGCLECGTKISKDQYKEHIQTHILDYMCSLCPKRLSNRWSLKDHIKKNHPERGDLIEELSMQNIEAQKLKHKEKGQSKVIECAHCNYKTDERRNFLNHFARMHALNRCTCQYCGQSVNQINFKRHIFGHENSQKKTASFMCEKCSKIFVQKRSLEVHILSCSGEIKIFSSQDFKCEICDYATGLKKSLRNHYNMVHAPKDSQCPICLKMVRRAKLSSHVRWHENRFSCRFCEKSNFASRWHLKVHILKIHPGNEQMMVEDGLLRVKKVSLSERKGMQTVECEHCCKIIKYSQIKIHLLTHDKQIHCINEGCTKLFANKYALKAHTNRCKYKTKIEETIVKSECN
uniref:CSON003660 protein n=1 Tax=Culicoides sonorensis TaxID=179676 RepID=A0A336JZ04_CULSO